jgi:hypothetical protein
MDLYHRTTAERATNIIANGFRDTTGTYMMDVEVTGVWLSDVPLDINDGGSAEHNTMLRVKIDLPEEDLADWEVVEEGKRYREWVIPAEVINRLGSVVLDEER